MTNPALLLISLLLSPSVQKALPDEGRIPHPEPLNSAAILQSDISDIDSKAMVIGNGGLNALIHSTEAGDILLTVPKNDVWDSRMNTSEDPPMPTVNVRDHTWTGAISAQASWKKNKYPIQVACCNIVLGAGKGITGTKLDLRRAVAEISSDSGTSRIRTLWQSNVFLIESPGEVSLSGSGYSFLPKAESGTEEGIPWLRQVLP